MALNIPIHVTTSVAIGLGTVFLTIAGAIFIKKIRGTKFPTKWRRVGTLKELYIYPLKSGKGSKCEQLFCTKQGVCEVGKSNNNVQLKDRSFLIYTTKDKEVRTARQIPKLVLIELQASSNGVVLSAPNQKDLYIDIPRVKNNQKVVSVWGSFFGNETFASTDCGDSAAKWISNFILEKNEGLRLGYGDGSYFRNVVKDHHQFAKVYPLIDNEMTGIFTDLAALHLVNQASIYDLNQRLPDEEKVTFNRFRPNFVVEGPIAFEEHKWTYLKIGDVILKNCLEVVRCIETTVRDDGTRSKQREPMKTLEAYRKSEGPLKNFGVMGIYLKVLRTGKITSGDAVYVSNDA